MRTGLPVKMFRYLILIGAFWVAMPCALPQTSQPASRAGSSTPGATGESAALLTQGLDALHANQPQEALNDFQKVLAADPNNGTANLLASTAAVELYQGPLAVQYAKKAQQLNPEDWKIHTSLVAAYAEAGDEAQRDQERALLRQMHQNGPPEARETSGFLLEMFPVGSWRVEAVEYFEPMGKFHIYYRFLVRQPDGKRIGEIDVQSDDFDERSWERAHAAEAAAGGRQFQLTGYGASGQERDYRTFSGKPDYDAIREMAVFFLGKQGLPDVK